MRRSSTTTPTIPHPHPSGDTIHTASPELVAQVSHLEALLISQKAELNDLVETASNIPGQEEKEEDDDLALELADLAESEELLRKELEQLVTSQCKLKLSNSSIWTTSVQEDLNILNNDRNRGWDLWWHVTIRASLALTILAVIMVSKPVVVERQGKWSRRTLLFVGPTPVPVDVDMDSTLAAFEPSVPEYTFSGGDRLSPHLRAFDLSTAEPSAYRPRNSEVSAAISIASQIPGIMTTPSSTGQTTIPAGSNAASSALAIIPANLPFYSLAAPFEFAERLAFVHYCECPLVFPSPHGQEGPNWNQRFTKASLLLTATWSYADRFAPAIIGDHGTAPPCV